MLKLNLGSSDDLRDGYISVDLYNPAADVQADVASLPYKDGEVDEIMANHIIEHADYYEAKKWLTEWNRVLKPGGVLIIETPDLYESCKKLVSLPEERHYELYGALFAKPWLPGEIHKFLYTRRELYGQLNSNNFGEITFEEPTMHTENPNLRVRCVKL